MPRNTIQIPLAVLDDEQIEQLIIHLLEVKRDFEAEDDLVEYANELDEPLTKLTDEMKKRKSTVSIQYPN